MSAVRIYELGIVSRIGHNLARYSTKQSDAYTPFRFVVECLRAMKEHGLERTHYRRLLKESVAQYREDMVIFMQGLELPSDGGSSATVEALLLGPLYMLSDAMESVAQSAASKGE
jgi:hypothetical protein